MDQDFHHYGTFYAARVAGFDQADAGLVAKASNFIDFLHEGDYGGYWRLVDDASVPADDRWHEVARLDNPRYTFQSGKLSTGVAPEDGLWCSFHFTPGNYDHIEAPAAAELHGEAVAAELPNHVVRTIRPDLDHQADRLLNRPQSALSRALVADTLDCATSDGRLADILGRALGADRLLGFDADRVLARFRLLLLGARAHVIADTWAHQDWSGIHHPINTYWDVSAKPGRQAIEYRDVGDEWKRVVLSALKQENLQAVPNGTSYLGHGWMGHFPDYSFVSYRYKPRWRERSAPPIERNNPAEYRNAFLELCSLFTRAGGGWFDPAAHGEERERAQAAIEAPCQIADPGLRPRHQSSERWLEHLGPILGRPAEGDLIDARDEPDEAARLDGLLASPGFPRSLTRYGTYTVNVTSDLYLFQIAADYHFNFVRHWLAENELMTFTGSWSVKDGPLDRSVAELF